MSIVWYQCPSWVFLLTKQDYVFCIDIFHFKICLLISPPTSSHQISLLSPPLNAVSDSCLSVGSPCHTISSLILSHPLFYLSTISHLQLLHLLPHQGGKSLISYISYLPRPPVITQISSISSTQCCTQFWLVWVRLINSYIIIT